MGCVSSKLFKKDLKRDIIVNNGGDYMNHVVSLTSSTYGVLKLENEHQPSKECVVPETTKKTQRSPSREGPEVINAWELMEDLEEGMPISNQAKKSPKSRSVLRGFGDYEAKSPLKFLNHIGSPKKMKRLGGKENKGWVNQNGYSPKQVLKLNNSNENSNSSKVVLSLSFPVKGSPLGTRRNSFGSDSGYCSWKKNQSPLFDPELVASYEKSLSQEGEQIKMMISPTPKARKTRNSYADSESFLQLFEKKCPPGGENSVVIYTTTLRGIRRTFENCNIVRSILESHLVHLFERDISMDSGFKEELRRLMGSKEVKVPLLFVKGRLIGGSDEVLKLEEEGKLGLLFDGIPKAIGDCEACGGVRFILCLDCNGSCKVLDKDEKKMVRCGQCNENGLVHCPICCKFY